MHPDIQEHGPDERDPCVRAKLVDFIRSHADKKEHAINDLVDSLFDQTYTLPDSLIGIVKNIALIGKSYRDRRKRREALRRVVVSLLEQVFDPVLQFRMQYKDILDTFQANDIDRDSVSHDQYKRSTSKS